MNQHPLHTSSESQWLQVTKTGEHILSMELSAGGGGRMRRRSIFLPFLEMVRLVPQN